MGPFNEQVVETSILPKDFDQLSKLSNEEKECWLRNLSVTNLLFENMDKELSDLIHKEDKLQVTRVDAHCLWKFLEAICEEDSDDEDQEQVAESLEDCSTFETGIHPLVTPPEDQGAESTKSASSQVELVRLVSGIGRTGLPRDRHRQSKKCSRRRSKQAKASEMSTSSSDVDNKCLIAKINEMTKENEFQVKVIKALTQELKMIKQEQASLA